MKSWVSWVGMPTWLHDGLPATLMIRRLMFGQAAIVDGVVSDAALQAWQEIVSGYGARLVVFEANSSLRRRLD